MWVSDLTSRGLGFSRGARRMPCARRPRALGRRQCAAAPSRPRGARQKAPGPEVVWLLGRADQISESTSTLLSAQRGPCVPSPGGSFPRADNLPGKQVVMRSCAGARGRDGQLGVSFFLQQTHNCRPQRAGGQRAL